jgi:hypothetical protein
MLARLLAHRKLDVGMLAAAAGVPEAELAAVLGDAEPSASLMRGLAPALGLHTSDLFLIAGRRVPADLAPTGSVNPGVSSLVWCMVYVPEAGRRVHELVRAQPRQAHPEQASTPAYDKWFVPGFGATLLRLFGNRNMVSTDAVMTLYALARLGPWSTSKLHTACLQRAKVPADLVASCAVVLGIPPGDLAALAGVDVPERPQDVDPATSETAELIWAARSLTAEQMRYLNDRSHLIRHEYDDVVSSDLLCHCSLFRGDRRPAHRPE